MPKFDPTVVCLFVDEFSNLDTRSSAMGHYQSGMFYLSAAQLASAIFSNIVPVLTEGPPRKRSALSQRFNTQCTQSQTMVSRNPPAVTQETSGPNRPGSTASNFHALSMDPPTHPLKDRENFGTLREERKPDRISNSKEDDIDLSSPITPPALSCINAYDRHHIKHDVSKAMESVETTAHNKELLDNAQSPNIKKLKKRNCDVSDGTPSTPIQLKDVSLQTINLSNVKKKTSNPLSKTVDLKLRSSPGDNETSADQKKSIDMGNVSNNMLTQVKDHGINGSRQDDYLKNKGDVDNSNDSDGMFFEERKSFKRNRENLVDDNSHDWVHAVKDADRHELLKCKRTNYKLEYGNPCADDIPAFHAVEARLEAIVIMRMLIIKKNIDPSGQSTDTGLRFSRDVRRFRKNSIRVASTESVMSARFMDAVLPKVRELQH